MATSILSKEDHILQGSELIVQYYSARDEPEDVVSTELETGPTDTLEVRNLPHSVSTDALQLYFENPKSGGCVDGVKEITIMESGVACIQLTDATGEYNYDITLIFLVQPKACLGKIPTCMHEGKAICLVYYCK